MAKRRRKNYTKEFKEEAVKLITVQGYSVAEAARKLGLNPTMLGRWRKETENSDDTEMSAGNATYLQAELKRLCKENKQLKLERERTKKGGSLLRERTEIRYQFIDAEKKAYPVFLLCEVMQVSRSGYYSWRTREPSALQKERTRLIPKVKAIHHQTRGSYGARRISEELRAEGESCIYAELSINTKTAEVPVENLDDISLSIAKCEVAAGKQIEFELLLN